MKKYAAMYRECVKIAVAQSVAYRADFLLSLIISLAANFGLPLVTLLIYQSGASFPGWTFYEVLLLQSVFTLSNGLADVLFGSVLWVTMSHVREGTYEVVLLKPMHPLFFIITSNFNPQSLSVLAGGGALMLIALVQIGAPSLLSWGQFLLLFLSGFSVVTGFSMMMAATSFKWVANSRIPEIFNSVKNFGKYPLGIFPKMLQNAVTFIIPVGMIGFYPASALLGRASPVMLLAVFPCVLFMLAGCWMYQYMIKLYEGVGG